MSDREQVERSPATEAPAAGVVPTTATAPPTRPTAGRSTVRRVLQVGAANDSVERQADELAQQVVRRLRRPLTSTSDRAGGDDGGDDGNGAGGGDAFGVRRMPSAPSGSGRVRRSAVARPIGPDGGDLDHHTSGRIARATTGGAPLEGPVRRSMEATFGAPLDHVRVHRGPEADEISRSIDARAFTVGRDVFFANGEGQAGSTSGQHTMAHELTHVLQNDGRVRRLLGFGNKGRTEEDEDEIVEASRSTTEQAAGGVHKVLFTKSIRRSITRFNRTMALLQRPDVAQVAAEYAKKQNAFLGATIESVFGSGFRTEYLRSLIALQGRPTPILRVRMALGAGGEGVIGAISDQAEVLRLFHTLSLDDQFELGTTHFKELAAGLSGKALAQVVAHVEANASQKNYGGETSAGLTEANARAVLAAQDRELGKIVSRAKKGEGTSFFGDMLSVKTKFNMEQLTSEVASWIVRAKKVEAERFDGQPVIRRYVLGESAVSFKISDDPGSLSVDNTTREFMSRMDNRTYLAGWNAGDRQMIKLMIASGATLPAEGPVTREGEAATRTVEFGDPEIEGKGDQAHQTQLRQAIGRVSNPKVVAALASLAGEITIQNTRGATNRRGNVLKNFLTLDSAGGALLYRALLGSAADEATLTQAGGALLLPLLAAAKIEEKDQQRIVAQLDVKMSKENLVALRRYAYKSSFGEREFAQLVAQLDAEERTAVREDTELVKQILLQYHRRGEVLAETGFFDPDFIYEAHLKPVAKVLGIDVSKVDGGFTHVDRPDDQAPTELADWSNRWALVIGGSSDEKKIASFAIQIMGDKGRDGLVKVYEQLTTDHEHLADWLRSKTKIGKALQKAADSKKIDDSAAFDYDVVGSVITASETARAKGSADVDTIVASFENLSGDALLDEWTNLHEYKKMLDSRKEVLAAITSEIVLLSGSGTPPTEDTSIKIRALLAQLSTRNADMANSFRLGISKARRKQLNTGVKQLTTPEYFTVTSKLAAHIASQAKDPDMTKALLGRGLMPHELKTIGEEVLFVSDQSQQANLATWHQWSLFTVKGQLREESAGLLARNLRAMKSTASNGTDAELETARKGFTEARGELEARTKSFKTTAKKYASRLKMIISLILDLVIIGATLGIGTVPVLAATFIQAGMSFAKDVVLAIVDKALMPSESNLLAETSISLIKTALKAGVDIGLGRIQFAIDQQLNLINAAGSPGGMYAIETAPGVFETMSSNALVAASGFRGMTAEHFFTKVASGMIGATMEKFAGRLIDTVVDAGTSEGADAFIKFFTNWNWTDAFDLTMAPFFAELTSRGVSEMKTELDKALGVFDAKTVEIDGVSHKVVKENNASLGSLGTGVDDDVYSNVNAFESPSFGAKLTSKLIQKANDKTFVKLVGDLQQMPVSELDAFMESRKQKGDVAEAKGTKEKKGPYTPTSDEQKAIAEFDQYRALAGFPATADGLLQFLAQLNLMLVAQAPAPKKTVKVRSGQRAKGRPGVAPPPPPSSRPKPKMPNRPPPPPPVG